MCNKATLPSAVLFDLDGVLVDTETIYTRVWSNIDRLYPSGIDNFAMAIKGWTLPRIFATYYPDPELQKEILVKLYENEDSMPFPLFDGVISFLQELRAAGIPTAIVTSSGPRKMERLFAHLEGFRQYFDAVITDADVTHSKPHPEPYLTGAARLGADISRAWVFEDSFSGMKSGRDAGATVIGVATTNAAEAVAAASDICIDGFDGLKLSSLLSKLA